MWINYDLQTGIIDGGSSVTSLIIGQHCRTGLPILMLRQRERTTTEITIASLITMYYLN